MQFFTLAIFLFIASSIPVYGQKMMDMEHAFKSVTLYQNKDSANLKAYKKQNIFLFFYKKYISSQDGQSCAFTPSCSVYGAQSVKQKGVVIGLLNTLDRLSRCNSPEHHMYPQDQHTHLLFDPVE